MAGAHFIDEHRCGFRIAHFAEQHAVGALAKRCFHQRGRGRARIAGSRVQVPHAIGLPDDKLLCVLDGYDALMEGDRTAKEFAQSRFAGTC